MCFSSTEDLALLTYKKVSFDSFSLPWCRRLNILAHSRLSCKCPELPHPLIFNPRDENCPDEARVDAPAAILRICRKHRLK